MAGAATRFGKKQRFANVGKINDKERNIFNFKGRKNIKAVKRYKKDDTKFIHTETILYFISLNMILVL